MPEKTSRIFYRSLLIPPTCSTWIKTGEINFIPQPEDKGLILSVDVENEFGKTWQRWELEIK